jgi:hypothetical protein
MGKGVGQDVTPVVLGDGLPIAAALVEEVGWNHYTTLEEDRETARRNSLKTGTAGNQIEPAGGNVAKHRESTGVI